MNHHESLGRYVELKEALEAARIRRHAFLNNLARMAENGSRDRTASFNFAEARALLAGAEQAQTEAEALEDPLREAAEGCGKRP